MNRLPKFLSTFACGAVAVSALAMGVNAAPAGTVWVKGFSANPGAFDVINQYGQDCDLDTLLGMIQNGNFPQQRPDCDIPPENCPEWPDFPNEDGSPDIPDWDIPDGGDRPEIPDIGDKPEIPDDGDNDDAGISSYAKEVAALVNQERASAGLGALKIDVGVRSAAQTRAMELEEKFSHTRPDSSDCFTALTQAGVSFRGAGENIAYGQSSPREVMRGWMDSSGHRANILNPQFTSIGVGVYESASGTLYWTQMFTY